MANKIFSSSSISTGEKQSGLAKNTLTGVSVSQTSMYDVMKQIINGGYRQNVPTVGGALTVNSLGLNNYDYVVKQGNTTVSSFTSEEWFTNTEDSAAALIVVNGNLTIDAGVTFQPSVRKLFTCIWVQGNLTVNGTITMTARGASTNSLTNPNNTIRIITGTYSSVTNPEVPSGGGAGGAAFTGSSGPGNSGSNGSNGGTGGGGSGGKYLVTSGTGGAGASGSAFSGGAGGGGANSGTATSGGANGGAGGRSDSVGGGNASGGGAGNPGGRSGRSGDSAYTGNSTLDGYFGTGGTLIIFVTGTLSGTGTISSNGSQGGGVTGASIGGGGGSGAGSVTILCSSGSVTQVSATGGARGLGYETNTSGTFYSDGGAGGNGTARTLTGFSG
jgi:hypothetical protein